MLELMRRKPGWNNRAVKRDVNGRDIDKVVSELLAQDCSIQCFVTAIRDRLVRCILREGPKKVPSSPMGEVAHDNAQILGLLAPAEIQQGAGVEQLEAPGASAVPPSASTKSFVAPQNAPVGRVASLPSSDSV